MLLLTGLTAAAQLPQSFSFQAVLRGNNGTLVVNEQISVKIRLLADAADGTEVYAETHSVRTNAQGVFVLNVGEGQALSGSMSAVRYDAPLFIEPQVKRSGASDFVVMRAQRVFASPYTTYAPRADEATTIPYADYVSSAQEVNSSVAIKGVSARSNEPVFVVNNSKGQPLFAVYENGVAAGISADGHFSIYDINTGASLLTISQDSTRLSIDDKPGTRPQRAGFRVGGMDGTRASRANYLTVSPEQTSISFHENYADANARPQRAGFRVGGMDGTRPAPNTYLTASDTGIRFAFREHRNTGRPQRAGFMVGGMDGTRGAQHPILEVGSENTAIYFNTSANNTRPQRAGFMVGGMDGTRAGAVDYLSVAPDAVAITSDSIGTNMVTNQVVSGFDVGGISQQQQDYTSYISVAYDQTTTPAIQTSDLGQQGTLKEGYDPNVVEDLQGNLYATAAVGNHRWLKTNLRNEIQSNFWKPGQTTAEQDSVDGAYYHNGNGGLCPDGYHVATWYDWNYLFDYTKQAFGLVDAEVPGKLLNDKAFGLDFVDMGYAENNGYGDLEVAGNGYLFMADSAGITFGLNISEIINWEPNATPDGAYFPIRCVKGTGTPLVYANEPQEVMTQSALLTATIESNGNMPLNDYGFILRDVRDVTGAEQRYSCNGGPFRYRVTGLEEGKTYSVRAYAVNNMGVYEELNGINLRMKTFPAINFTSWNEREHMCEVACTTGVETIGVKTVGVCYGTQPNPTILNNCLYGQYEHIIPGKPGATTYVRGFEICENDVVVYTRDEKSFYTTALPQLNITSVAVQCSTDNHTNCLEINYANVFDNNGWDYKEITVVRINGVEYPNSNNMYWSAGWGTTSDTGIVRLPIRTLWNAAPSVITGDNPGGQVTQGEGQKVLSWNDVTSPTILKIEIGVGSRDKIYYSEPWQYTMMPLGVKTGCDAHNGHGGEEAILPSTTMITYQCGFVEHQLEQLASADNYQLYLLYRKVGSTSADSILWEKNQCYDIPGGQECFHGVLHVAGLEPETEYELWPVLKYGEYAASTGKFDMKGEIEGTHKVARTLGYGTLTDVRDGNTYRTVIIEGTEWMAENLRYTSGEFTKETQIGGSNLWETDSCYYEVVRSTESGVTEPIYNSYAVFNTTTSEDICPDGWELPSYSDDFGYLSHTLGERLKGMQGSDNPWLVFVDTLQWTNAKSSWPGMYQDETINNPFGFGARGLLFPGSNGVNGENVENAAFWAIEEEKVGYNKRAVPYNFGYDYSGPEAASVRCKRSLY